MADGGGHGRALRVSICSDPDNELVQINRSIRTVRSAVTDVETWLESEDELVCLVQNLARRVDEVYELQQMQERRFELRNVEVHELYSKLAQQRADSGVQGRKLAELKATIDSHHGLLAEHQCHIEREISVSSERHSRELEALKAELMVRRAEASARSYEADVEDRGAPQAAQERLAALERSVKSLAAERRAQVGEPKGKLEGALQTCEERMNVLDRSLEQLAGEHRTRTDGLARSCEKLQSHADDISARSLSLARRCDSLTGELSDMSKFRVRVERVLENCEDLSPGRRKGRTESADARATGLVDRLDILERELRALASLNDQGFSMARGTLDQLNDRLVQERTDREAQGTLLETLRKSHASLEGQAAALLESQESAGRRLRLLEEAIHAERFSHLSESPAALSNAEVATVVPPDLDISPRCEESPCSHTLTSPTAGALLLSSVQDPQPVGSRDLTLPPRRIVKPTSLLPSTGAPQPQPLPVQHPLPQPMTLQQLPLPLQQQPLQQPLQQQPLQQQPLQQQPLQQQPLQQQPLQQQPPPRQAFKWLGAPVNGTPIEFPGPFVSARRPASAGSTPQAPLAPVQAALTLPAPPPLPAPPVLGALAGSVQISSHAPKAVQPGSSAVDIFSMIDCNHDGVITRAELKQAFA